jgi:hypothetical protein
LKFCDVLGRIAHSINVKPPTRQIKSWQLEVLWRLDKIRFILGGKKRKLTRTSARSLIREQIYINEKIQNFIKFNFSDLDLEIANTGKWFVKNYRH